MYSSRNKPTRMTIAIVRDKNSLLLSRLYCITQCPLSFNRASRNEDHCEIEDFTSVFLCFFIFSLTLSSSFYFIYFRLGRNSYGTRFWNLANPKRDVDKYVSVCNYLLFNFVTVICSSMWHNLIKCQWQCYVEFVLFRRTFNRATKLNCKFKILKLSII